MGVLAHELIGAPMVLDPLDASTLPKNIVWLHHFSWHVGSVSVIAIVGMYWYASSHSGQHALAIAATTISGGFAILGIGLAIFGDAIVWTTPAPYVWTLVAGVGAFGVARDMSHGQSPSDAH